MTAELINHHEWNVKGLAAPFEFILELSFPEKLPYNASMGAIEARQREVQYVTDTARRHGVDLGHCDVCGRYLKYNYLCRDSAGKSFIVGCDCVEKLDDTRLMTAVQIAHEKAQKRAENQRKIAVAMANRAKRVADWLEVNPELADAYSHCTTHDDVWHVAKDIAHKVGEYGSISPKQIAILVREYDKFLNPKVKELVTPAPTGRLVVTGEVISFKWVPLPFGYNAGTLKVLVKDDRGFKVFGRLAASLEKAEVGSRVTFTATLEPSQDDPGFAFFARPAKGEVLSTPDLIVCDPDVSAKVGRL
jgi:hypothetical protein